MEILQDLKKRAQKQRQDIEQVNQNDSGMFDLRSMEVVSCMQKIQTYLHELIEHLNFIQPDIRYSYKIDSIGELSDLHQSDYKLITESSGRKESLSLVYTMVADNNLEVEMSDDGNTTEQLDFIKNQGLLANQVSRRPSKINVECYVPVQIELVSDFQESNIRVVMHNYDKLGNTHYLLNTDNVTDELLNELGLLIMREENQFIDVLNEDSHGISLQMLRPNDNNHAPQQTEEMDISRLRSLFNREQRLYLTYHNNIKDIGSRTPSFVMGRAQDCELMINSDLASRHHAKIVYRKGKFVLIDQSTNGTFVKPQGGKEVYVQSEQTPLAGAGFISLGKAITVDNEHLIYYSCQ